MIVETASVAQLRNAETVVRWTLRNDPDWTTDLTAGTDRRMVVGALLPFFGLRMRLWGWD